MAYSLICLLGYKICCRAGWPAVTKYSIGPMQIMFPDWSESLECQGSIGSAQEQRLLTYGWSNFVSCSKQMEMSSFRVATAVGAVG